MAKTQADWLKHKYVTGLCWHTLHHVDCIRGMEGKCRDMHNIESPDIVWTPGLLDFYEKRRYKYHQQAKRIIDRQARRTTPEESNIAASSNNTAPEAPAVSEIAAMSTVAGVAATATVTATATATASASDAALRLPNLESVPQLTLEKRCGGICYICNLQRCILHPHHDETEGTPHVCRRAAIGEDCTITPAPPPVPPPVRPPTPEPEQSGFLDSNERESFGGVKIDPCIGSAYTFFTFASHDSFDPPSTHSLAYTYH